MFTFSLSTPDRVYQFSSDSKQLVQTWIEILTNACRQNPFFSSSGSASTSASLDSSTRSPAPSCSPAALTAPVTPASSGKRSLADPYIHLTECYSGNKARAWNEDCRRLREVLQGLKPPTITFKFETPLRHYDKQTLTPSRCLFCDCET